MHLLTLEWGCWRNVDLKFPRTGCWGSSGICKPNLYVESVAEIMFSGRVFNGDGFAHYELSRPSRPSNRRAIRAARVFSNSTLMSSRVVGSLYTCEIRMGDLTLRRPFTFVSSTLGKSFSRYYGKKSVLLCNYICNDEKDIQESHAAGTTPDFHSGPS
jgi:hypothetical protein